MKKFLLLLVSFLIITLLALISGCGNNDAEKAMLGDYYSVKNLDANGVDGKPIKFITVIELTKNEATKNYTFKETNYSVGQRQVVERQLEGTFDEKKNTLEIGNLPPFVYDPQSDTMMWNKTKYIHITKERQVDFDKVMNEALVQRIN